MKGRVDGVLTFSSVSLIEVLASWEERAGLWFCSRVFPPQMGFVALQAYEIL